MPTATSLDAETITRLRAVICRLSRHFNVSPANAGLTPSQISVLGSISTHGPIGIKELAARERLNATMVSRIITALQELGLIDRLAHPDDRRAALVTLTTGGRQTLDRVRAERTRGLVESIEQMSGPEAAALLGALPALESLARQFGIDGTTGTQTDGVG